MLFSVCFDISVEPLFSEKRVSDKLQSLGSENPKKSFTSALSIPKGYLLPVSHSEINILFQELPIVERAGDASLLIPKPLTSHN